MSKVSITQIGFALLCIGSVFMYSTQITDPYIVSKWLYTILFVCKHPIKSPLSLF